MPLQILWQDVAEGETTQVSVPILDVELKLTIVGDVITDAAWVVGNDSSRGSSPFAGEVQRYLLNPGRTSLQVKLLSQGSGYAKRVWDELLAIPVGQVQTYSALAAILNSGSRAVAGACRNNPYAGIIPCHRVVAKAGIGGFMGQANGEFVALKRRLLQFECEVAEQE